MIIMQLTRLVFLFLLFWSISFQSQVKGFLNKAARSTENGYLENARKYYLKALAKDKDNYNANIGMGITLSEFMGQPEEALPYLENAYKHTPKDTLPDLFYALAKCYQHVGKYNEAIFFLEKLNGSVALDEDDKGYQLDLTKRKADCVYAMSNSSAMNSKDWYVVNLGSNINSKTPEYVPVITPDNELLFTSKRQDHQKEKINDNDGKYFESMYISKMENGRFTAPRRYTIPDLFLNSKFSKHHESIISMSPDGKKLFIYRDNKIFEVDLNNVKKEAPKKLSKNINFDYYQNHAYLSKDGKTLFFTSEADGGLGGLDIYKSEKNADGVWAKPVNLGPNVNTPYDEDAPFLSDDGQILYFASRGLPGYGNFDLYKSTLTDGKWGVPENLGLPINSQAHDIFMVQNKDGNIGYFSSGRPGGKGDMDIYKINYLKDLNKPCITEENPLLTIKSEVLSEKENKYAFTAILPDYLKILKYEWKINNEAARKPMENYYETSFEPNGDFSINVKAIVYCDTCFEPMVICNTSKVSTRTKEPTVTPTVTATDLSNYHGALTKDQLLALGFDLNAVRFNFNTTDVSEGAKLILDKNLNLLKAHPELKLEIYGYADSQGKSSYNKNLSDKRANSIKNYLITGGLDKKQIVKTLGKGATNLLNNCTHGEDCGKEENEINRRVEFTIIKK